MSQKIDKKICIFNVQTGEYKENIKIDDAFSYNNFYFPKSGSFEDYIEMTYLYDEQKNLYIRIRHIDPNDSSMVDYFGPCNSGESAELIKEKFDTYALSGGKN